jgi:hypothetical protein
VRSAVVTVTRQLNKQASLRYHMGVIGRRMCGDGDKPGPLSASTGRGASAVGPTRVRTFIRQISPHFVKSHHDLKPQSFDPVAFGLGSAPHFREPYAGMVVRGRYLPIAGYRVSQTCAQSRQVDDDLNLGKTPTSTTGELVLVVTSSKSGSAIKSFDINYTAGDKRYTLPVKWALINCGTEVTANC